MVTVLPSSAVLFEALRDIFRGVRDSVLASLGGCPVWLPLGGCTVGVSPGGVGGCPVWLPLGGCTVGVSPGGCPVWLPLGGCTVGVSPGGCPVGASSGAGCSVSVSSGGGCSVSVPSGAASLSVKSSVSVAWDDRCTARITRDSVPSAISSSTMLRVVEPLVWFAGITMVVDSST